MSSIFRNIVSTLQKRCFQTLRYSTTAELNGQGIEPIIDTKLYENETFFHKPREAWVENLDTIEEKKLGLITLHPEIFAASPRIDIVHENVKWQKLYRFVSYAHTKTRAEVRGGGRKPWRQKEIPSKESSYIEQLIEERNWGPSVLIVDSEDIMPTNLSVATDSLQHVNLMPVYGLNVYSMLKHDTLVLTQRAARLIEEKLLFQLNRADSAKLLGKFKLSQQ
ncbi:hypothetical protein KPH14_012108 [Odynerus spinipes]|uniref:Large ribosomal subunit protein uL4m n=1 Tax=Odynerus spinipes TaxID=1348599 RepID=A0AAD9VIE0_9HYME|nr:hypothetical protein KPH14_012108 [Odynerus spinipes]